MVEPPSETSRDSDWLWAGRPRGRSSSPSRVKNFLHVTQTGSWVHPTSYPIGTRGSFPKGKAVEAWSWPLTSVTAPLLCTVILRVFVKFVELRNSESNYQWQGSRQRQWDSHISAHRNDLFRLTVVQEEPPLSFPSILSQKGQGGELSKFDTWQLGHIVN
jgi:hypothetical protein